MASQDCCCRGAVGGMILGGIELAIGVALVVIGPLLYGVESCYRDYYLNYYYCTEEDYLIITVSVEGGLCIFSAVLLFCGFGCRSLCTRRLSLSLTSIAACVLIWCGVQSIYSVDTGLAVILFVVSGWLFCHVSIVVWIDRAVRRPPVARDVIFTVSTPAPQPPAVIQPTIQNNYINQMPTTSNTQNHNYAPASQPIERPPAPPLLSYNPDQPLQPCPSGGQYVPPNAPNQAGGPPAQPYYPQNGPSATNNFNAPPPQSTSYPQKPPLPNDAPATGNTNPAISAPPLNSNNYANPHGQGMPSPPAGMSSAHYPPPTAPNNDQFDPRRRSMYASPPPANSYGPPQGHVMPSPSGGMNSAPYPPPAAPYNGQSDPRRRSMYASPAPAQGMPPHDPYRNPLPYPPHSGYIAHPPRY